MNHIKEVADILGLKLNEEFMIEDNYSTFRITEKRLEVFSSEYGWVCAKADILIKVLLGEKQILKTYKPKYGEIYYIPCICVGKPDEEDFIWSDSEIDLDRYVSGMVCKTPEKAKKLAMLAIKAIQQNYIGLMENKE